MSWCIGTCATMFSSEVRGRLQGLNHFSQIKKIKGVFNFVFWHIFIHQVQFGHAGACANQASETAVAKNKALKEAGAYVPKSFDELGEIIK